MEENFKALEFIEGKLRLIDQRLLPGKLEYVTCSTAEEVTEAIRSMIVRGAPAIGGAAGYGVYLALLTDTPVLLSVVYIAFSQSAICFGIGVPLALYVSRSHVLDGFRRGR